MTVSRSDILARLETEQNEDGMRRWQARQSGTSGLTSHGIGLTRLRKLAREFGRDHDLAVALWQSDVYDAKIIAILIDDPKQITRDQAERQVDGLDAGQLEHVFCSCGAPLAKTAFVVELAHDWARGDEPRRRSCGYGLIYELSKLKTKRAPDEAFFLDHIAHIDVTYDAAPRPVRISMGGALLGMGKRSAALNTAALKLARRIGPIEFDSDGGQCDPLDLMKHLTSDYVREKLGV